MGIFTRHSGAKVSADVAAWLKGYRAGLESAWSCVHYIAEAQRLLELCRVAPADRALLWEQACDDVRSDMPDLPVVVRRAVAARRITAMLCERVRLGVGMDEHLSAEAAQ